MSDKEKNKAADTPEEEAPKAEESKAQETVSEESPAEEKAEEKAEPEKAEAEKVEAAPRAGDDKYLRLLAEYDNFRKRSQKEKDDLYAVVRADAVTKFLPVYDNLERALAQSTEDEAYRKGVEMIMNQFRKTLDGLGVTEIECLGKTFDPKLHNAIMHVDDETKGENEIIEVFQKGFRIGEKVIRYAMVKVAN